ncbi:MAG: hypothetical protein LBS29_04480 [Endomicrobium sp.]|jgi:hypothetical protein|nr:hypothetical protein [Endomicrobium sp.]
MSRKFAVDVVESYRKTVFVVAKDIKAAKEIAHKKWLDYEIEMNPEDRVSLGFVSSRRRTNEINKQESLV